MIAGFEVPDSGRVVLQGADVTAVSANRRPVNMVFHPYALFPHLSIYDHAPLGLKVKRVALARALVNRPAALLLDEPLGAVDVKLRKQMQLERKRIQHVLGTTFVYVTHDQEEALAMSDRIAVMNHGRVEQIAGPEDVYDRPATTFVAGFIGVSNLMPATVTGEGEVRLEQGPEVK